MQYYWQTFYKGKRKHWAIEQSLLRVFPEGSALWVRVLKEQRCFTEQLVTEQRGEQTMAVDVSIEMLDSGSGTCKF